MIVCGVWVWIWVELSGCLVGLKGFGCLGSLIDCFADDYLVDEEK